MVKKTKEQPKSDDKAKNYVLKPGCEHSYILNGERRKVVGDGRLTVPLSPGQFEAFKDKLLAAPLELVEEAPAETPPPAEDAPPTDTEAATAPPEESPAEAPAEVTEAPTEAADTATATEEVAEEQPADAPTEEAATATDDATDATEEANIDEATATEEPVATEEPAAVVEDPKE